MTISLYNHKGGTGKTTTCINLGKALREQGCYVLLVDLDPQANLTYSLGIERNNVDDVRLTASNIVASDEGFDVLPNFTSPDFLIDYQFSSPFALREELSSAFRQYDYVLIDCPPAMNMTVVNALMASDGIIIPMLLDALSLEALRQVLHAVTNLSEKYQHRFNSIQVLPVMVDGRRQLAHDVKNFVINNYKVHLFTTGIRMNVKIAEAPSYGESVIQYQPKSNGAIDYLELAKEFKELSK